MGCSTRCVKCGDRIDKFSGKLINIADSFLPTFYKLPSIVSAGKTKAHPTLCSSCMEQELGSDISIFAMKFKSGRWMTSNVAFILRKDNRLSDHALDWLKSNDRGGILDFKKEQTRELFNKLV